MSATTYRTRANLGQVRVVLEQTALDHHLLALRRDVRQLGNRVLERAALRTCVELHIILRQTYTPRTTFPLCFTFTGTVLILAMSDAGAPRAAPRRVARPLRSAEEKKWCPFSSTMAKVAKRTKKFVKNRLEQTLQERRDHKKRSAHVRERQAKQSPRPERAANHDDDEDDAPVHDAPQDTCV